MSNTTFTMPDTLYTYFQGVSLREPEVLSRLREETAKLPMAMMQIAPEQGQFMQLLIKALGVRRVIEVGVFTGYSSLCIALALPDDGRIVACDVSEEWTNVAKRYWKDAGVEEKIALRLAPAIETLDILINEQLQDSFDFAFIDADKTNYKNYYERALTLIRPGGIIAIDNTLWGGSVIDESNQKPDTIAIRELNRHLHSDQRVDVSMLPIGDGLTLALKR